MNNIYNCTTQRIHFILYCFRIFFFNIYTIYLSYKKAITRISLNISTFLWKIILFWKTRLSFFLFRFRTRCNQSQNKIYRSRSLYFVINIHVMRQSPLTLYRRNTMTVVHPNTIILVIKVNDVSFYVRDIVKTSEYRVSFNKLLVRIFFFFSNSLWLRERTYKSDIISQSPTDCKKNV